MSIALLCSFRGLRGYSLRTFVAFSKHRAIASVYFPTKTSITSNYLSTTRDLLYSLKNTAADDILNRPMKVAGIDGIVPSSDVGINDDRDDSVMLKLSALKLDDLKSVIRKLGGKPGSMKKQELVNKCYRLLMQYSKQSRIQENSVMDTPLAPIPTAIKPNDIKSKNDNEQDNWSKPLPPIGRVRSLSSAQSSSPAYDRTSAVNNNRYNNGINTDSNNDNNDSKHNNDDSLSNRSWYKNLMYRHPVGARRDDRNNCNFSVDMILFFLGTASCVPSTSRGVSSIGLRYMSDTWLFDCGESTQVQIQKSISRVSRITKIFITHNHGDHCFGLPGILCLMGQSRMFERDQAFENGVDSEVVDIYGPEGIRDYVRSALQLTYSRIAVPHRIHELKDIPQLHTRYTKPVQPFTVRTQYSHQCGEMEGSSDIYPDEDGLYHLFEENGMKVTAAPLQHTVPCIGYVVNELPKVGTLRIDKVKHLVHAQRRQLEQELGLTDGYKAFQILKMLKPDEEFVFPDGTIVKGSDVVEPAQPGRKVVILGDTCNNDMIAAAAKDADVLVHEATNAWIPEYDRMKYPKREKLERDTFQHGHSTPHSAGYFAKKIRAKKLILTHFSPRYKGDDSEYSMSIMWRIEEMARAASGLYGRNDVIAAWDLMAVSIPTEPDKEDALAEVAASSDVAMTAN